ncbi:Exonuclease mut-7 [Dinochytrium kinnereticum]|nr:Exonuclease mut-7 [Dinochytrium kinnereticum]
MSPPLVEALRTQNPTTLLTHLVDHSKVSGKRRSAILSAPNFPPSAEDLAIAHAIKCMKDPLGFFLDVAVSVGGNVGGVVVVRRVVKAIAGLCCLASSVLREKDIAASLLLRFFSHEFEERNSRKGGGDKSTHKRKRDKGKSHDEEEVDLATTNPLQEVSEVKSDRTPDQKRSKTVDGDGMVPTPPLVVRTEEEVMQLHIAAKTRIIDIFLGFISPSSSSATSMDSVSPLVPFYLTVAMEVDIYGPEILQAVQTHPETPLSGFARFLDLLAFHHTFPECATVISGALKKDLVGVETEPSVFNFLEMSHVVDVLERMVHEDDLHSVYDAVGAVTEKAREVRIALLTRLEERCKVLWRELEESFDAVMVDTQVDSEGGGVVVEEGSAPPSLTRFANHSCSLAFKWKVAENDRALETLFPSAAAGCRRAKVFWLAAETNKIVESMDVGRFGVAEVMQEERVKEMALVEAESCLDLLEMLAKGVDVRLSPCLGKQIICALLEHCQFVGSGETPTGGDDSMAVDAVVNHDEEDMFAAKTMLWVAEEFARRRDLLSFFMKMKEHPHSGPWKRQKKRKTEAGDENMAQQKKSKKHLMYKHLPVYDGGYPIAFVDSEETLMDIAKTLRRKPGDTTHVVNVALDCEWAPDVLYLNGSSTNLPAAILQMGLEDSDGGKRVFVLALGHLPKPGVEEMLIALFSSKKIRKLGFSFENDISRLAALYPQIPRNVKYMKDLANTPKNEISKLLKGGGTDQGLKGSGLIGLADLCRWVLGKRLSKSARISDWERRPLRAQQLRYAGNDVAVLLDIFSVLQEQQQQQQKAKGVGGNASSKRAQKK